MKISYLASGKHFHPFSQIAVEKVKVKAIFSLSGTYFSVNLSFRLVRTSFLLTGNIPRFFLLMENITYI